MDDDSFPQHYLCVKQILKHDTIKFTPVHFWLKQMSIDKLRMENLRFSDGQKKDCSNRSNSSRPLENKVSRREFLDRYFLPEACQTSALRADSECVNTFSAYARENAFDMFRITCENYAEDIDDHAIVFSWIRVIISRNSSRSLGRIHSIFTVMKTLSQSILLHFNLTFGNTISSGLKILRDRPDELVEIVIIVWDQFMIEMIFRGLRVIFPYYDDNTIVFVRISQITWRLQSSWKVGVIQMNRFLGNDIVTRNYLTTISKTYYAKIVEVIFLLLYYNVSES